MTFNYGCNVKIDFIIDHWIFMYYLTNTNFLIIDSLKDI